MKTNQELQKDVQDAMKWQPSLHAAEIGVTVKDAIVTLTGTVDGYYKKTEAETAAKGVAGVNAVVEEINVKYPSNFLKTNNEIAAEVVKALKDDRSVPNNQINVKVEDGWVTLDGELAWHYQKDAAKSAVARLSGVKGITNDINIKSEAHDTLEKKRVEDAFTRHWSINAEDITVSVSGTKITLTGTVTSLYQKDEAARIAWDTPGVWSVENNLVVEYDYALID
ncbi:BON domain-containing protein [Flavobacterium sp. AC]|uniref:BON domain-containing protein n=1 Tax=Flavobacterium azizsancarii TaxID=2961580 RepID=A0ABT4WG75_9FLAO|nr:BON domain-containing protein [Flavobacterium azizsancarii]MDA6071599.1 BON domain-containing protein [Flavobacterium azizsancarii]